MTTRRTGLRGGRRGALGACRSHSPQLAICGVLAWATLSLAGPDRSNVSSAPPSGSRPTGETLVQPTAPAKPGGVRIGASPAARSSGRPAVRGPKVPPALRNQLQRELERRIDRDLGQVRTLRGEAIDLLTTFVRESPSKAREMPEALLRLGELTWEREREESVARFQAWESKPAEARGPAPEPNLAPARGWFARVIGDYSWFAQMDLALYIDGFLAHEQGKREEALARFDRILKEFPQSRFRPDAHMARAEALFNDSYDYAGALAEYEQVLTFKSSELYGLAMFKSAWCLWRLGRSDEAARRFVAVFEITDDQGRRATGTQRKHLDELESEALKYLVEVFTEDDKNTAQDVYAFLTKIRGDRFAGKVVRTLAAQFYDQAHFERGVEAYELLLRLEPASPEAGRWILAIAEGYNAAENWTKLRVTYERAAATYGPGSAWARSQTDAAGVVQTADAIEAQLREQALQLHAKAQKDRASRTEFEGAAGLYGVYVAAFGTRPHAPEVHFHLAEIDFYHLENPTEAAVHYMAAARMGRADTPPEQKLRRDAIFNAIAALEQVRALETDARKREPTTARHTETDKHFAEALNLVAQLYPNDPALPELFFRHGKRYYDDGAFDGAVAIWGALIEKFPRSPSALGAGELILESFNRAKDYENIELWARRLKSAPAFASEVQQKKLEGLIVQSVFKQGEQKSAAGNHLEAARAYLRAAKEFPRDGRAAQACVNAELEAQKARDTTTLREAARLVTGRDYHDRPESPRGAWVAATTFQSIGLFGDAAEFYESIGALGDRDHPHYATFEHARDAHYNAVVLRLATGDYDRAIADGNRYVSAHPTAKDTDEFVFQMGKAHQRAGRTQEAIALYQRFLAHSKNQDHRVQGLLLLAEAMGRVGDDKGADDSLRRAVEIGKHRKSELTTEGKVAAAHARYKQGERVLSQFERVQIQGDVKQLSARLKQKADLLKQASQVFLDVVSLGVAEWTTAALYQIGRAYEQFAQALREAPVPSGLSESEKDAYQQQIDTFVVPIEERSLDAYENGWKKATDLGIYNQWTAKMREALGRLNGELYPPVVEIGCEVRSQGPVALPALLEAPTRGSL